MHAYRYEVKSWLGKRGGVC